MPESPESPAAKRIVVDGDPVDLDDLNFREQRELRKVIRDELIGDAEAHVDLDDLPLVDFLPAVVYVFKRRTDENYTLEQALELKTSDVLKDVPARPTRRTAKRT